MKRTTLKKIISVFAGLLTAELLFLGLMYATGDDRLILAPAETTAPATIPSTAATAAAQTTHPTIPETTAEPTTLPPETTVPPTTQPQPEHFTLTFVGDCTLGATPDKHGSSQSFVGMVGEDYDYPFANVADYFYADDLTLINLEGVFADSGYAQDKRFTFRGPTAYTGILTGSSVEAVTLANNHSKDFGADGYNTTKQVLEEAGVAYVEENKTALFITASGLTIGLYADAFQFSEGEIRANVEALRAEGAEVIVCAFHWGTEGSYRCDQNQQRFAHAAIDAGADIVYGHHPHVLQKIEQYGSGVIFYSLGNFSFGGNSFPRDYDSAVIQQEIIRDPDGTVKLGELTIIPVSISSMDGQNNFQPTPYEAGSEGYDRVISKLDGSFTGPDLVVNYEPQTTEPPATQAPETAAPETQAPKDTQPAETGEAN